jgi:hypothetical protein
MKVTRTNRSVRLSCTPGEYDMLCHLVELGKGVMEGDDTGGQLDLVSLGARRAWAARFQRHDAMRVDVDKRRGTE